MPSVLLAARGLTGEELGSLHALDEVFAHIAGWAARGPRINQAVAEA